MAETTDNYKSIIRPEAELCKKELDASDDDMNGIVNLQEDLFTEKAKCVAACVLEKIGTMKDGRWTAVEADKRLQVYRKVFAGDSKNLEAAESVINICHVQADEKFKGRQGEDCNVAYDAIRCYFNLTKK